jgi:hypothetical protein
MRKSFSKAKFIFKFNQNAFQIESDPILKSNLLLKMCFLKKFICVIKDFEQK